MDTRGIYGYVYQADGTAYEGATVTLTSFTRVYQADGSVAASIVLTLTTNAAGRYSSDVVAPARYVVAIPGETFGISVPLGDGSDVSVESLRASTGLPATNAVQLAIEAALAGLSLDDLADVTAPAPADGEALTWDAATSRWIPAAIPADEVTQAELDAAIATREPALGNPAADGYVLQSTAAGLRSWLNLAVYALIAADNQFTAAQGIRGAASGNAAGLYVPWITGDTLPAIVGGASTSGNNRAGVKGMSNSGNGVEGVSTSGQGVIGTATTGIGVYGTAANVAVFCLATGGGTPLWAQIAPTSNNSVMTAIYAVNSATTPAAGTGLAVEFALQTSTSRRRAGRLITKYASASDVTDATRAGTVELQATDYTTDRAILTGRANGTAAELGFLGAAPVARQTVTGSRGGNAALASLLTALATAGLITDSTTA